MCHQMGSYGGHMTTFTFTSGNGALQLCFLKHFERKMQQLTRFGENYGLATSHHFVETP